MKAVVVSGPGQQWRIQEAPMPVPGPHQVLVRVAASSICRNDLGQASGVPGHEVAGEIVELGAGVMSRKTGDRVGITLWQSACGRCEWCQRGRSLYCAGLVGTSIHRPGGHAEYLLADAETTVLLPDGLAYEHAAPIMCAGYAAYSGLHAAQPRPGDRVAVVGIGGIGHLAIQYAAVAGFHTIAVSGSRSKEAPARSLGADEFVSDGAELAAIGGADVVLATSSDVLAHAQAFQALRPEGRLVIIGMNAEPLSLATSDLIVKRLRVLGSQHNNPEHLYEALALSANGRVKVAAEAYPLNDAEAARQRVQDGAVRFRAVLTV